jgi:phosphoribosylanthranilate isomerase
VEKLQKMIIIVCGISDEANFPEIRNLLPDMIGFIFHSPSPRYVSGRLQPDKNEITTPGIKRVGVFVDQEPEEILIQKKLFNLDYIQLHGNETPEYCFELKKHGCDIIKAFHIEENFDFSELRYYKPFTSFFLFDTSTDSYGGSGRKFNWSLLKDYNLSHPFILSGGIGPEDAGKILSLNNPSLVGIDLNSAFEISPGLKNMQALKIFIKEIRTGKK